MRYVVFVCRDPELHDTEMPAWEAFHAKWQGKFVMGEQLHPVTTATTVRVRDGKTLTTDGPFAETKELIGGVYVIDVADMDEAIALVSECPGATNGAMEIRPIFEYEIRQVPNAEKDLQQGE